VAVGRRPTSPTADRRPTCRWPTLAALRSKNWPDGTAACTDLRPTNNDVTSIGPPTQASAQVACSPEPRAAPNLLAGELSGQLQCNRATETCSCTVGQKIKDRRDGGARQVKQGTVVAGLLFLPPMPSPSSTGGRLAVAPQLGVAQGQETTGQVQGLPGRATQCRNYSNYFLEA